MITPEERQFLDKVRALHAEASTDIRERIDGNDHWLEGRLIPSHPRTPIALFDVGADYRDIGLYVHAHRAIGLLLRIRDEAAAYYRRMNLLLRSDDQPADQSRPDKPYSPAQNCAIHCGKPMFQRYMFEAHGLDHPHDPQRMATRIRSLLAINSRADLDTDPTAAARWHDLRANFKAWRETKL